CPQLLECGERFLKCLPPRLCSFEELLLAERREQEWLGQIEVKLMFGLLNAPPGLLQFGRRRDRLRNQTLLVPQCSHDLLFNIVIDALSPRRSARRAETFRIAANAVVEGIALARPLVRVASDLQGVAAARAAEGRTPSASRKEAIRATETPLARRRKPSAIAEAAGSSRCRRPFSSRLYPVGTRAEMCTPRLTAALTALSQLARIRSSSSSAIR